MTFPEDVVVERAQAVEYRILEAQLARIDELNRKLNSPAVNVSARRQPRAFSARFGPISMQTARRSGTVGFEGLATVVDPGSYITPVNHNPLVGQFGPFWWVAINTTVELSWTYTTAPGFTAPVVGRAAGDYFDPAIKSNGGAMILNNIAGTQQFSGAPVRPRVSFDIDLYDKTRGRSLTSGRTPGEWFCPLGYGPKVLAEPTVFEHGTELEPRMYVNECRMNTKLDTTTPFNAASVAAYVTLCFYGYTVLP